MITTDRNGLNDLAGLVIGAAFEVSNELGCGFLERVYERALIHELSVRGITAEGQKGLQIIYKGVSVGEYMPDIIVDGRLIVELKCCDKVAPEHIAQCINYLKATGLHLALLLNFQRPKVEIKRIVQDL